MGANKAGVSKISDSDSGFSMGKICCRVEGCKKVSWTHLILPKSQGGLGLVDPRLKASVLHGQWIIKALSLSDFPWKGYILARLKDAKAVVNGYTLLVNVFASKPLLKDTDGSPIWKAIWNGWKGLRSLLKFAKPCDKEAAVHLRIQGHGKIWKSEQEKQICASSRITAAGSQSVITVGDLWHWEES